MLRKNPTGHAPKVSADAFIDPTAVICGHVIIEENVYVGPYVVIRADELNAEGELAPIHIKKGTNIQDGVVIHAKDGAEVVIGENSSIAHRAIVHGPCVIADNCFVGFNSVLFHCTLGEGCVVRHSAVIEDGILPPGRLIPSMTHIDSAFDLATLSAVEPDDTRFAHSVVDANHGLVQGYKTLANEL